MHQRMFGKHWDTVILMQLIKGVDKLMPHA